MGLIILSSDRWVFLGGKSNIIFQKTTSKIFGNCHKIYFVKRVVKAMLLTLSYNINLLFLLLN
ncbi:MAG TPA: hypothetical protein DCL52_03565 [Flavobacteriaceae bacterium]|nr:hypothetical protein [Flavobacteriaceae bacterium]